MRVNYSPSGSWHNMNSQVSLELGVDPKQASVKLYKGLQHALLEITDVLISRFPNKKKSFYIKADTSFKPAAIETLKSGYDLQAMTFDEMKDENNFEIQFPKDTLFALFPKEDVFFGINHQVEKAKAKLLENRIITIEVCHSGALDSEALKPMDINEIRIIPIHKDLAVVLFGKRLKLQAPVAENLYWSEDVLDEVKEALKERSTDKAKVEQFEQACVAGAKALLSKGTDRVYDRAAIYWDDMDASALKEVLDQKNSKTSTMTTSPSYWNDLSILEALPQLESSQVRGGLVVDVSILGDAFNKQLEEARSQVLDLQAGASK